MVQDLSHQKALDVYLMVDRWHRERGWKNGFGYHGLVMPDGTFFPGRRYDQIGAHCMERNRGSLGFLLIESKVITGITQFSDWFTPNQARSLRAEIARAGDIARVTGHNAYAKKWCPGFKVRTADWL
jgi:N-acetylmuramoyl-L-alanine amidase